MEIKQAQVSTVEIPATTTAENGDVEFEHTARFSYLVNKLRDLGVAESIIR
eukprot:CAMPEP_0116875130 /NCGR_PEP_ID=MMETSP0463-20121206/6915_1 /TAXON_ID=181622 /ORGANISM="Strombidinopsis sp, Strain SopsisLIS2011" /LENGTH=50 /DNA_ID=CAMNT_0004520113 /DNA_START=728 /DNA_END=880 /DNA_ORIENTATION=+